jgi:hypothetical protein
MAVACAAGTGDGSSGTEAGTTTTTPAICGDDVLSWYSNAPGLLNVTLHSGNMLLAAAISDVVMRD